MKFRFLFLLLFSFAVAGCGAVRLNIGQQAKPTLPLSGVFKTPDRGDSWFQKGDLYVLSGQSKKLSFTNVTFLKFDPQDPNTLYMGTDNGIYYSFSRGEGWFQTLQGRGVVNDVAIAPDNKCTLYAAVFNRVYKTVDCTRNWDLVHFSSLPQQFYTAILVSYADSNTIYLGTSDGAIISSKNGGVSWEVLKFVDSPVTRLLGYGAYPNSLYLVTPKFGIQKSDDGGLTWVSLNTLPVHDAEGDLMLRNGQTPVKLNELQGANTYYDLKFDTSVKEGLIYASAYGIFRLIDGAYWQEINTLSKPLQTTIHAVDIDTVDGKSIFFATTGALYRSENGGKEWTIKSLPSIGIPRFLVRAPDSRTELHLLVNPQPQR